MNKNVIFSTCLILITIALLFSIKGVANKSTDRPSTLGSTQPASVEPQQEKVPADKIEVVHFHGTRQCWSCLTIGEYTLQTIKDKFPEEYQSGKIVFEDINSELPENKEIVNKYQARGSSLFVNTINNNKDSITEDTTVWRLVTSQIQFTDYFENKLKTLLGE
ncbi:hypothetical protein KJ596_00250 [Patescibacteria group bacterium]|nr:hypothetical protein [Patescibacteria group bacterium]MBU1868166.1 hypothetical protein [Patescibacteria group bacterium]